MSQMFEPNFAVNSRVFDIAAEGELANILSHFNTEYIYSSLKTNIAQRMNRHSTCYCISESEIQWENTNQI